MEMFRHNGKLFHHLKMWLTFALKLLNLYTFTGADYGVEDGDSSPGVKFWEV
jgi:hypothetical protein